MGIKETITLKYESGRPGGWVHDLTLFSDSSIWVQKRMPGYYAYLPLKNQKNIEQWCAEHLQHNWSIRYNEIYISQAEDATAFALKWS